MKLSTLRVYTVVCSRSGLKPLLVAVGLFENWQLGCHVVWTCQSQTGKGRTQSVGKPADITWNREACRM